MLPRNGFFKNIRCPYDKAHLCLRPYCHYKHATPGNAENKIAAVSSSYLYDTNSNLPSQKRVTYSSETVKFQDNAGYIPTPVNKPASILKVSEVPAVPEYKPTPISKLKELNIPHGHFESNSYSPEYVNPVKRKKHIEEYDPTEIKFVPKKSVSFADESGGGLIECEPGFSSDEDFDDSASAPKFSDDDFEDNVQSKSSPPTWAATSIKKPDPPIEKEKDEESDLDEKKIDEFSLVDKILIETKRNEKLLKLSKRDVVQVKPIPIPEKTPLILKGAKAKNVNTSSKKPNKTFSNSDIYSMEDDSQGSIPDYSAFDSILPPIEIDTLIKNKYDKKTFDSTVSIANSLQRSKENEANTTVDASKSLINDKSSENSTKIVKENSKVKKSDEQSKSSNIYEKSKDKKKLKSTKSSKASESKLCDSSKQKVEGKLVSSKNSEKDKGHNKQSSEKVKNSKKTSEKSKDSSNKSKEVSNKTSDTVKKSSKKDTDKIKDSNKNVHEKAKSKSNEKSLKHKINSKNKSNIANSSNKDLNKNIVSSSSDAELQDGKVSSSCVVNKSKSGEKATSSKTINSHSISKLKHISKDSNSSKKPFKRKSEFSDSDSNSDKEHSKSKTSFKRLKRKDDSGSMDESDEEISSRSKVSGKKSARYIKSSDEAVSTSDDDVKIIEIGAGNSDLKKSSLSLKKKRTNSNNSNIDEDIIISSDSDCDPSEECWKIYNETFNEASDENTVDEEKQDIPKDKSSNFQDVSGLRKKRLAHAAAATIKKPKSLEKLTKQPMNPGQVMHNRYALLMKMREDSEAKSQGSAVFNSPGRAGGRIAVSPNNSLLAAINEKKKLSQSGGSSFTPLPATVTKTLKPTKRVAHIPDMISKPRPIIPADFGSKVPTNIRQKFLNTFIDEYLKITSTEEDAYDEALEEEKKAYLRSSSKAIYMNVASNALAVLRRKSSDISNEKKSNKVTSSTSQKTNKSVSHEAVLNGPLAQRTSFSIEKKKPPPVPDLKGTALYEYLLTYAMSEDQLRENGFPMPHPSEPGKAIIEGIYANKSQYCNDQFKRTCCRCQKVYYVNVDGDYVRDEECDFHWGRLWKRRIAGAFESRYSCCQGDAESDGCCVGTGHVYEGSEASALKGYVKTLPKTPPPDKYYGIYALDCEMCYTTAGIELTRVTVVGPDLKPVYETFVKPSNKVLDYNTRFSGITEDNLKNCRATLRDVQAVLLCLFNSRTILLGHSLESDFKALKLMHTTVVDTSVVFPHKMGLPYKRALRTLMGEKLNKIIQNEIGGHDSQEDAMACMELMLWKIKEDLRSNR